MSVKAGIAFVLRMFMLAMLSMVAAASEYVTYLHADGLGSPIMATDEQGQVVWLEEYEPWGARQVKDPASATASRGSAVWYTGKEEEASLGMYYYGARWYSPAIGHFTSIDPVGVVISNARSFNRYVYANNNPIMYIDPDGRWASKAGFYVHQDVIKEVIGPHVSGDGLKALKASQVYADSTQFQNGDSSFRHAMRNGDSGQTTEEANALANKFVRSQFEKAWAAKDPQEALFEFGIALHTLQDATSPSHTGFQSWGDNVSFRAQMKHGKGELYDPGAGSNLHSITQGAWKWFNERKLPDGDIFNVGHD